MPIKKSVNNQKKQLILKVEKCCFRQALLINEALQSKVRYWESESQYEGSLCKWFIKKSLKMHFLRKVMGYPSIFKHFKCIKNYTSRKRSTGGVFWKIQWDLPFFLWLIAILHCPLSMLAKTFSNDGIMLMTF